MPGYQAANLATQTGHFLTLFVSKEYKPPIQQDV
jgi:hypothetical protein